MKRERLQDAMARRSPLAARESVAPVDLYTVTDPSGPPGEGGDKETSRQLDNRTSGQVDMAEKQHVDLLTTKPASCGEIGRRRYTTYLKPGTIKAIKWLAVDGERNDYEIVQEALDEYLRRLER